MEVVERVGPSVEYWRTVPFAYLLWTYRHLQELDRRRQWVGKMQRLESGMLTAMGFHDPKLLDGERTKAIADAGAPMEAGMDRARQLAEVLPRLLADGVSDGER